MGKKNEMLNENILKLHDVLSSHVYRKVMKLITVSAAGLSNSRIADNKLICDQIRQFSIKVTKRNFESWKKTTKII